MSREEIIRKCLSYIEDHLEKNPTVDQIAAYLNYSAPQLRRIFRDYTGFSIGQYIRIEKTGRAASALKNGLCVADTSVVSGYGESSSLSHAFGDIYGVAPSRYISAKELPIIKIHVPVTIAGYILRRAEGVAEPGLALWHGYDFSSVDVTDFQVVSPEGGAEVGIWTEIDGEKCYLFGICCKEDAAIPDGMVRYKLPKGLYAMFPVPEAANTQELSERIHITMGSAIAYCDSAKTFDPICQGLIRKYWKTPSITEPGTAKAIIRTGRA